MSLRSVFHCFYWGKTLIAELYAKFGAIQNFINLKTDALVRILRSSTVQNALKKDFFFLNDTILEGSLPLVMWRGALFDAHWRMPIAGWVYLDEPEVPKF